MNTRTTSWFWMLGIVLWAACATSIPSETEVTMPELISQVPLPALSRKLEGKPLKLELKIHIGEDGSVLEAQFASSSGDPDWDRQALEKVSQWKFSPARYGVRPIPLWIKQSIVLQFTDQLVISLAEIRCTRQSLADSLYRALMGGADFSELARRFSVAASGAEGGRIGRIDVRTFPYALQERIRRLSPGEYTPPLRLGEEFVLFRRLQEERPNDGTSPAGGGSLSAAHVLVDRRGP